MPFFREPRFVPRMMDHFQTFNLLIKIYRNRVHNKVMDLVCLFHHSLWIDHTLSTLHFWHFHKNYFPRTKKVSMCCLIRRILEEFSDRVIKFFFVKQFLFCFLVRKVDMIVSSWSLCLDQFNKRYIRWRFGWQSHASSELLQIKHTAWIYLHDASLHSKLLRLFSSFFSQ